MGFLKTDDRWRGQGCAQACVNNLAVEMRSHGVVPYVFIEQNNTASLKLFQKLGYEKTHEANWIYYLPEKMQKFFNLTL